ncbi:sensor histidine kinase N-terminal domain-containing protein [Novosphingobium sp. 9U]|uniref:sensor histidine kinase N-terminal domain-containing protein n=1 Tax=Novosphingobium sp. 9U TaxID=2653158 RepID=UPI001359BDDE|nr:sensor histidine kinase N-terminal domain-containing protein [Novosphingobium sp. 9U]
MMPLVALALTFGGITCWMIYRTISIAADRALVGAARTLAEAVEVDARVRGEMLPVAVDLLRSRSAAHPLYSIHEGARLLAGSADLPLPPDYAAAPGSTAPWHEPPRFPSSYREAPFTYARLADHADVGVIQPAYLREASFGGRALRIAAEVRRLDPGGPSILIQAADYLDDRRAFEQTYYMRVAGAGVLILMIALLLFYGAVT